MNRKKYILLIWISTVVVLAAWISFMKFTPEPLLECIFSVAGSIAIGRLLGISVAKFASYITGYNMEE
jgi:NhaP-type Na+/H+ or K+/H+ antiporter